MADYPYLPELGECDIVGIQREYMDPVITTPFENGMVQTRARFPRVRRSFVVPYKFVSEAARHLLDDFVRNVVYGGSGIFVWVDPLSAEEINVRFKKDSLPKPVESDVIGDTDSDGEPAGSITYALQLEMEEV